MTGAPRSSSSCTASTLPARTAAISSVSPEASRGRDVRAGIEQTPQHRGVAVFGRDVYRGDAECIGRRRPGAGTQQHVRGFEIVGANHPVQRRGAIRTGGIDVHALLEQPANGRAIASRRGSHQRVVGCRRNRRHVGRGLWTRQQHQHGHPGTDKSFSLHVLSRANPCGNLNRTAAQRTIKFQRISVASAV